ncbi:MAG: ABC transporter ATP-binding protein [Chloroflexi bacterium]|nr:ABC transporter ATP-binding protein [Chloroflexota bacterium]
MYLTLDHVVKQFPSRDRTGTVSAVNDISIAIEKDEFVTLLGPSGCGKTTTLRLIAGFEYPTAGTITLDGAQVNDLPPNRRDMAMVFQSYAIFPHLNVFENIAYGLRVKNLPIGDIKRKVADALELTELTGLENRAPNQLSGGQQQRVALARALVMEPKVLLFDEPLSNLDAKLREQMRVEIRLIQQRLHMTSVYVTHDQAEAMTLSDRIVVMNRGQIEQIGSPQAIYQTPATRFVADFIGKANFVPARVVGQSDGEMQIEVFDRRQFRVPRPDPAPEVGSTATLVIRPEAVTINRGGRLLGVIQRGSYLGSLIEYEVTVAGQPLAVSESDPRRSTLYAVGASVEVGLIEELLYVLPAV